MLSPLALGFTTGFLLSIPPDSGSLEAVNRGIQKGFISSFLVGIGGVIGDTLYYLALMFGFRLSIDKAPSLTLYMALLCFSFLLLVGLYYLLGNKMLRRPLPGKIRDVVLWFRSPFLFGLVSSLLTPATLVLTVPFYGMLLGRRELVDTVGLLAGLVLGGILWSLLLSLLAAGLRRKICFHIKNWFRKATGLIYATLGLCGVYVIVLEMVRN